MSSPPDTHNTMWIDNEVAKTPLRFVISISKPYRKTALFSLMFGAGAAGLGALVPLFNKYIVDTIGAVLSGEGSFQVVMLVTGVYLAVYLVMLMLWRGVFLAGSKWATGVRETGRHGLFSHVLGHGHSYFENRFAGSVANKINHAVQGAVGIVEDVFSNFWPAAAGFIISLALASYTSPLLGVLFFAWLMIAIPINIYLAKRRIRHIVRAQRLETKLRGTIIDILTNVRGVHEYARRRREVSDLEQHMITRREAGLLNWRYGENVSTINRSLQIVFMGLMLAVVLVLVRQGLTTPGTIILVFTMMFNVGNDVTHLSGRITSFAERYGEIKEGLDDVFNPHEITEAPKAKPLTVPKGEISFDNATFVYQEGSTPVLEHFDLVIKPGEKIGLVGRSGAGKSTLIKLLLRHYDLTEGSIKIDNTNIADVTLDSLRESIAIVPQEPLLFHRSVWDNIAYGKADATDEEVRHAAWLAQAEGFIDRLPEGYQTMVGERGVKLSGGERQRVAIARAILKNAPILLLDEATSALDSESELAIQNALHELMQGKTVIAIAHRLSTLREMDRIIVLDHGSVIEEGSHDELVKGDGSYSELWHHQAGGFISNT